jgi:hypothetical protein
MPRPKFTQAEAQILREQIIDTERPGPVLHDFQVLLDFIGPDGVKSAGKYHLLPQAAIAELDERLSRPLRLPLERPQLRSHPYLQGLHLLLRSSRLGCVAGAGEKARLTIDPIMREQWDRLNATERYFNLLEAWLRFSRGEMIAEGHDPIAHLLQDCLAGWLAIRARRGRLTFREDDLLYVSGIGGRLYHLALMDLFGLVELKRRRPPVHPWSPAGAAPEPFGDALFTLLATHFFTFEFGDYPVPKDLRDQEPLVLGTWQPLFQPYFPEWQHNLESPRREPRKGTLVFRVTWGDIWRRIAIPSDHTLDDLVGWILKSVRFDSDHLYAFSYRNESGVTEQIGAPDMGESPATDEVAIGDLPLQVGEAMTLEYDFGASWTFTVKLEKIEPASKKGGRILERHGKPPVQYPVAEW